MRVLLFLLAIGMALFEVHMALTGPKPNPGLTLTALVFEARVPLLVERGAKPYILTPESFPEHVSMVTFESALLFHVCCVGCTPRVLRSITHCLTPHYECITHCLTTHYEWLHISDHAALTRK